MRMMHICVLAALSLSFSCARHQKEKNKTASRTVESHEPEPSKIGLPVIPASTILTDFNSFWQYYTKYVELYEDFTALDTAGKPISKESFLKQLNSGLYLPVTIRSKYPDIRYQLYQIPPEADKNIPVYMRQFAKEQWVFYQMEGKKIPAFSFSDINGKHYTSASTKGKIVLFKCWFIACVACVKEMPALNELVRKYKDRDDILFISLAMDSAKELQQFLKKTRFDYATVPDQQAYMSKQLNVSVYPTHFLINKDGLLVHVLPNEIQVAEALEKEAVK